MMKRILLYLYMVLPLLLNGCSDRNDPYEPLTGENTQISFSLKVENMHTRSGEDLSEIIDHLEVLVFEDTYGYTYRTTAEKGEQGNQYSIRLRPGDVDVTLLMIANHTDFQELEIGDSTGDIQEALLHPFPAEGLNLIPMYGEVSISGGINSETTIGEITLLRSVAAVEVSVSSEQGVREKFLLQTIQGYRVNNQIQVIPSVVDTSTWKVSNPSVPFVSESIITTSFIDAEDATEATPARMYLPEAEAPANVQSEATCLIVGGIYRGSNPSNTEVTYYRIDIRGESLLTGQVQPTGQILRNNLYRIKITDVTGPGTTHPEEADGQSIVTTISDWGDSEHPLEL